MAIGFTSFGTVTAIDADDPNTTPPDDARVISAPNKQGHNDYPSRLTMGAHFTAGGANDVTVVLWVKDNSDSGTNRWFALATLTGLNDVSQVVNDLPPNAELFAQVTAINGAPTDATVRGHFH